MDPPGPAQPPKPAAYTTPSNPVSSKPSEEAQARRQAARATPSSGAVEHRSPFDDTATVKGEGGEGAAPPLARGIHSHGPVDQAEQDATAHRRRERLEEEAENENVDAEQMAPAGEGLVAEAVERKSGGGREGRRGGGGEVVFDDYAADLDRKKAEQAASREAVRTARRAGIDPDGGSEHVREGVQVD